MPDSHQFDAVFLFASEAILITNDEGKIVRINPSGEKLFGYSKEEVIGERIDILIPTRFQKSHQKHVTNYHDKPKPRSMGAGLDLFGQKKNGLEFPVEVSLSPCKLNNRQMVVAFIVDITERKKVETQAKTYQLQLEKEVEDRTLILQEAIAKLENTKLQLDQSLQKERELNQLKSRFISTASHEFRTPLATVMSSLSLVEKYNEHNEIDKVDRHLLRIKKSIRNLTEILNDVLSVNKIEEGKVFINPTAFIINDLLEDIVSEIKLIAKAGQDIQIKYESKSEYRIVQDSRLLRHIISNMLSNALKFSPENAIIEISVKSKSKNVEIKVKDDGIGIPKADLENLFTRFFRSENAGQIQGTGLGLSIAKQYSQLIGGDVSCKSEENKGSEFIVSIPKNLKK